MDIHRAGGEAPQVGDARSGRLQVLATTKEGTRAALVEAKRIARRLKVDRVVLVVPRMGSPTSPIDRAAAARSVVDDYRLIAHQTGIAVSVRECLCSGYDEVLHRMLPRSSVVVVGGRRRWWWPTREQRIADHLKSSGHETIFAESSALRDNPE